MSLSGWLSSFLRERGITKPEGKPLYWYRCRSDQLEALEQLILNERSPSAPALGACLVLAAAERFRRDYREGPWSWEDCGRSVSQARTLFGFPRFTQLIIDGLKFWRLRLVMNGGHRQFLDTVVLAGGLPVALLHGQQSALRRLLRRLIKQARPDNEESTFLAAKMLIEASPLPRSFKESDEFKRLCADLADQLAAIALRTDAVSIAAINAIDHGWADALPIRVDDSEAEQLVNELLVAARQTRSAESVKGGWVRVLRHVRSRNGQLNFAMSIEIADSVSEAELKSAFGLEHLPAILYVHLQLGDESRGRFVCFRKKQGCQIYKPQLLGASKVVAGNDVAGAVTLVAESSEASSAWTPHGGELLDDELPWVFESPSEEEIGAFVGQGTTHVSRWPVWLRLPAEAKLDREISQENIGTTQRMVVLDREIVIRCPAGVFRITQSDSEITPVLRLFGKVLHLRAEGTNAPVFAGMPRFELSVDERDASMRTKFEWRRVINGSEWSTNRATASGHIVIRAVANGEEVARSRAVVLPQSFRAQSVVTGNGIRATITIDSDWRVLALGAENVETIENQVVVRLPVGARGDVLAIILAPPGPSPKATVDVSIPLPPARAEFRDRVTRKVLSTPQRVSIAEVHRYDFVVNGSGRLLATLSSDARRTAVFPVAKDGFGRGVLSMLSIRDDLDGLLDVLASASNASHLKVWSLEGGGELTVTSHVGNLVCSSGYIHAEGVAAEPESLVARALGHPEAEAFLLHPATSDKGRRQWAVPHLGNCGSVLVTDPSGRWQPMVVATGGAQVSLQESRPMDLGSLLTRFNSGRANESQLDKAINDLGETLDDNADEIAFVEKWAIHFNDVPAHSLDFVKALRRHPGVLIHLLNRSGSAARNALLKWGESFPIFWHTTPLPEWQAAAEYRRKLLEGFEGLADEDEQELLDAIQRSFRSRSGNPIRDALNWQRNVHSCKPELRRLLAEQDRDGFANACREWTADFAQRDSVGDNEVPLFEKAESWSLEHVPATSLDVAWRDRPECWRGALATPLVCAEASVHAVSLPSDVWRDCAMARLWDPDHFDEAYSHALMMGVRGNRQ